MKISDKDEGGFKAIERHGKMCKYHDTLVRDIYNLKKGGDKLSGEGREFYDKIIGMLSLELDRVKGEVDRLYDIAKPYLLKLR